MQCGFDGFAHRQLLEGRFSFFHGDQTHILVYLVPQALPPFPAEHRGCPGGRP